MHRSSSSSFNSVLSGFVRLIRTHAGNVCCSACITLFNDQGTLFGNDLQYGLLTTSNGQARHLLDILFTISCPMQILLNLTLLIWAILGSAVQNSATCCMLFHLFQKLNHSNTWAGIDVPPQETGAWWVVMFEKDLPCCLIGLACSECSLSWRCCLVHSR